jgi:hypothetical protein
MHLTLFGIYCIHQHEELDATKSTEPSLFPVTMIEQISALSQFGRYSVLFSEVVCWCMD